MAALPIACRRFGLLLVGHGTRSAVGQREFLQLAELLAAEHDSGPVEPCFLELAEPGIEQALARLVGQDMDELMVVPLLLFAAGHAKRDIPSAVAEALAARPTLPKRQTEPLGCHEALVELSARRYQQALADLAPVPAEETVLVLVGRGSRDEGASAEMRRFAALRAAKTPVGQTEICFYAMAPPSLTETLTRVAQAPARRVVVQPHLLFQGELLAAVAAEVERQAEQSPQQQWVLTCHLGPDPLLARAVLDRVRTAAVTVV